jgi:hypothetical protein
LTLISVAKPWIVASPMPEMSHSERGFPARQFSAVIAFAAQAPANEIVAENCLEGNPASEWDVSGAGDASIQGFATDISPLPPPSRQRRTRSGHHPRAMAAT